MNNDSTVTKSPWLVVHYYEPIQHPMLPKFILGYSRRASTLRPAGTIVEASDGTRYVIGENKNLLRVRDEVAV